MLLGDPSDALVDDDVQGEHCLFLYVTHYLLYAVWIHYPFKDILHVFNDLLFVNITVSVYLHFIRSLFSLHPSQCRPIESLRL